MIQLFLDFLGVITNAAGFYGSSVRSWCSVFSIGGAIALLIVVVMNRVLPSSPSQGKKDNPDRAGIDLQPVNGKIQFQESLDFAPARRRVFASYEKVRKGLKHPLFSGNLSAGVVETEEYVKNSRGIELYTKNWLPESGKPKALVFLCHGYGDTITFYLDGMGRRLAAAQFAVFGMDYEGFGLSEGLHCYIHNFDQIVDDVIEHYTSVKDQERFKGLPCFLFGQSMGGAVALKAHLKKPRVWDGAVLVAPMCKLADDMYPPWLLVQILKAMVPLLPRAKIIPGRDLAAYAFKEPDKRAQTAYNVVGYGDKPRLRTAWELLVTTQYIEDHLSQISMPLLILHGGGDKVTDPSVSKALYERASSLDKTLHLYEDVWHAIIEGEPDETIEKVLADIINWLDLHSVTS